MPFIPPSCSRGLASLNFPQKMQGGFTLVEMIIYVAILGIIAVLSINATLAMTRAFTDLRVSRDLNSSATALFERLTRDIRGAYDINVAQSTLNTNPGRLTLDTRDSLGANTTIEFYVENGIIKIREGGVAQGTIMTTSTSVTNFVVRQLVNANTKAVKIEATISATRGDITRTRNFYSTVVLRGTY
jgi:prepilin-type N-terminal cleavage/methylation domain-containing protein